MRRDEIRVHVVNFGRKFLYMRYRDPDTGKSHAKSTGCTRKRDAERAAAKWEAELQEGRYKPARKTTWEEFRERYEAEVMADGSHSADTAMKVCSTFNAVEQILKPIRLAQLTAARIGTFRAALQAKGLAVPTIKGHLSHLLAAMRWAHRQGMLTEVPVIDMPKRVQSSKGRPIAGEEFERMLLVAPKVVTKELQRRRTDIVTGLARCEASGAENVAELRESLRELDRKAAEVVASWRHFLRGLWWSGLRLEEARNLWWERRPNGISVELNRRRPMLWIPGDCQKNRKDELYPIAPEFAEFLLAVPEEERTGRVFSPQAQRGTARLTKQTVSRIISQIGEAANVKVSENPRTGKVKHASAHDLRRSFGERWSERIMPKHLKELMRHADIATTMKFYVGQNADRTADVLWNAVEPKRAAAGHTSGHTSAILELPGQDSNLE